MGTTAVAEPVLQCADKKCGPDFPCVPCVYAWLVQQANSGDVQAQKDLGSKLWADVVASATDPFTPPMVEPEAEQTGGSGKARAKRSWAAKWRQYDGQWCIDVCASAQEGDEVVVSSWKGRSSHVLGRPVVLAARNDRQGGRQLFLPVERSTDVEVAEGGWYVDRGGNAVRAVRAKAGHLYGMRWNDERRELVYEGGLLKDIIGVTEAPVGFVEPEPVQPVERARNAAMGATDEGLWRCGDGTIVKAKYSQQGNLYGLVVTDANPNGKYTPGIVKKCVERLSLDEAKEFGRRTGRCCVCARLLT